MSMILPLMQCWRLCAQSLPDSLQPACAAPSAFSLPGAQALSAFAELLGDAPAQDSEACAQSDEISVPFSLPALLPDALEGEAALRCEIDFGALRGDRAVLTIDHLLGSGSIYLGDEQLIVFDSRVLSLRAMGEAFDMTGAPCALAVDLTDALRLGRRETLTIRFDETRPAGLCGAVMLRTARYAHLSRLLVLPDPARQTMQVRAQVNAMHSGTYVLRVLPVTPDGMGLGEREISLQCEAGGSETAELALSLPAARFVPGVPYDACALKITLLEHRAQRSRLTLCDSVTVLCGYAGKPCEYALPLTPQECALAPGQLAGALAALHIPCVRMASPASDALYRALTRAGIGVRMPDNAAFKERLMRLPCVNFAAERIDEYAPVSLEGSAWQMGSLSASPRAIPADLPAHELLAEIAGRSIDAGDPAVQDTLRHLRAVCVRLRAEAARQGRLQGALCAPGEWQTEEIAQSLSTAFAPLHVSILPLYGAWWSSSRFSATIHAFLPDGAYTSDDPLIVTASLEDDQGQTLAALRAPCRTRGGSMGVLEAQLPGRSCILQLTARLTLHDAVLCERRIPVYVGERGPLEAAWA